jgi:hypothetical protein
LRLGRFKPAAMSTEIMLIILNVKHSCGTRTELLPNEWSFHSEDSLSTGLVRFQGSNVGIREVANINESMAVAQLLSGLWRIGEYGIPEHEQRAAHASGRGRSTKRGLGKVKIFFY